MIVVTILKWLIGWFVVSLAVGIAVGKFLKWHNTPRQEELEPPLWVNHEPRAPVRVHPENGEVPVTIKEGL